MAYDVFISYTEEDERHADAALAALEAEGLKCWIAPRDIAAGDDWGAEIIKGIKSSRVMLVIFSSHANKSRHIKRELTQADEGHLPVITFRVEDTEPADSLAYYLDTMQWLDAFPRPAELHPRLVGDVKRLLSTEPPPPSLSTGPPPPTATPPPRFPQWLIVAGAVLLAVVLFIGVRAMRDSGPPDVVVNANNANANSANVNNTPAASSSVAPSPSLSPAPLTSNNNGVPSVVAVATPAIPADDTSAKITRLAEALFSEGSTEVSRKDAVAAMEPLAKKDLPYQLQVVGHLTDFIRKRAAYTGQCSKRKSRTLPVDLQAAIEVLGSRRWPYGAGETERLELSDTDLSGAFFTKRGKGVNFKGVRLRGACLDNAILGGANFQCAYLSGASMAGADVWETDLRGAVLPSSAGAASGPSQLYGAILGNATCPSD